MVALRSAVFAAITIGLTTLAHAAAGGSVPPPVALGMLLLVTAVAGLPLFRRSLRPSALIALVGGTQAGLHPVFEGLAAAPTAGHIGHGSPVIMLGAHVAAGVLAVLLVSALDPAVRCLPLGRLRLPRVRRDVRPATERPCPAQVDVPIVGFTARVMTAAAPRRGPPRLPLAD